MSGKAISVPHRALGVHSSPARPRRAALATRVTVRDVVLATAFLFAFPVAITVTGALSEDGLPDRAVPLVERGAP